MSIGSIACFFIVALAIAASGAVAPTAAPTTQPSTNPSVVVNGFTLASFTPGTEGARAEGTPKWSMQATVTNNSGAAIQSAHFYITLLKDGQVVTAGGVAVGPLAVGASGTATGSTFDGNPVFDQVTAIQMDSKLLASRNGVQSWKW